MDRPPGDGVHSNTTPDLHVGKYRIVEEVGRGSMGVVYRAVDEQLRREVALKSPLPAHASAADRHRLLREARAASRVSHPQIVPIYEVFEAHDRPWIAMELVVGETLRAALRTRGRLPVEEVLLLGEQLGEALDAAHAGGVLHGDLNPNNVMLTPRGGARLMDFGLARLLAAAQDLLDDVSTVASGSKVWGGTLGYISPEQILGRQLDASSDLFSLGAVLYEASTGQRPFKGGAPGEILDATLHTPPPRPSELRGGLPPEWDRIIVKALSRRPDERYRSAREMLADLRALRRRLVAQDRIEVLDIRSGTRWKVVAAIVVALIAVPGFSVWYVTRSNSRSVVGPPRQLTTASGWEAEPKVSPDGTLIAYASDQRGNADIWLLDVATGAVLRLTDDPASDRSPAWFPDGSTLAFVSDRGGRPSIWKTSRLGGPSTLLVENAEDPAISPDGTKIAFARRDEGGLYRISVAPIAEAGNARVLTRRQTGLWDHRRPAWSPDGSTIAYDAARDLWAVTATGSDARRLTNADAADREPAWSPNGRFLYFSSNREGTQALWRVSIADGSVVRLTGGQGPERQPSITRDGSRLFYSTFVDDADLVIRDLQSGREQRLGGERIERSPVFSPTADALAFVSDRWMGRHDVWLQSLGPSGVTADARRLTDHPGSVAQPAFAPDGRWIAYHRVLEGQRDIWTVSTSGAAPLQFTVDPARDTEPDWSPDGRRLAFLSDREGSDQLWIAPVSNGRATGQPRRVTNGPPVYGSPTWSTEGSTIAFVGGDLDVWIVDAEGRAPARRLTQGAFAERLDWDRSTGMLWASGSWGGSALSLRAIDVKTGEVRSPASPIVLSSAASADFDLSWDGRRVVFAREQLRGDLWVRDIGHAR